VRRGRPERRPGGYREARIHLVLQRHAREDAGRPEPHRDDQGQRPSRRGLIPRPFGNCYHCSFKLERPACGTHCVAFLREAITELATNEVAAIVVEPIQGWGGSVIPPDDWLPKIRQLCDELGILLFVDEVLTCMGRTGKMFCVDHWNVVPDIMTLGKVLATDFPSRRWSIRTSSRRR